MHTTDSLSRERAVGWSGRGAPGRAAVGLLALGLLVMVGCQSSAADVLEKRAASAASPTVAAAAAAAGPGMASATGNTKTSGSLAVTLNGYQFAERGTYVSPKEGMVFLMLDVVLENQGQQELTVGSRATVLKDAQGKEYRRSLSGGSKPSPDSTLPPGKRSSGEIAYEVPKDAESFQWTVTAGDGAPPAVFEIKK